jgi:hypothetical protein
MSRRPYDENYFRDRHKKPDKFVDSIVSKCASIPEVVEEVTADDGETSDSDCG